MNTFSKRFKSSFKEKCSEKNVYSFICSLNTEGFWVPPYIHDCKLLLLMLPPLYVFISQAHFFHNRDAKYNLLKHTNTHNLSVKAVISSTWKYLEVPGSAIRPLASFNPAKQSKEAQSDLTLRYPSKKHTCRLNDAVV